MNNKINCPYCGEEIDADATVCPYCDEQLENDETGNKDTTEVHEYQEIETDTIKCPYCGEEIWAVAKKCKHCGEWIDKDARFPQMKTILIIALGIVCVILFITLIANKSKNRDSDDVGILEEQMERDDNLDWDSTYVYSDGMNNDLIFHLEGCINELGIVMKFTNDNEGNLSGYYYFIEKGENSIINISGTYNDGRLFFNEVAEDGSNTGYFDGEYSNGIYEGQYTDLEGGGSYAFYLSEKDD